NNPEQLIKNADIALHEAKKQGKNRCEYFSSALEMMFQKENDIEEYILSALENNRFYMTYQTQYTMDKKIRGIESLIRLCNDNGETVSPVDFIPVAEKSDLIIKIDDWVLEHVLDDTLELVSKTNNEITVSVNVSAKHIMSDNYAKAVIEKLEKRGYPAKSLEIEITEYCLLGNLNNAIENLTILRNAGVQIAIDDFGTGYSSLGNISKLPIDLLKIDKVFIDNAAENQLDEDFINIIISIAHLINCKVICEGVEQEAQLDILRRHSCDYIQGFLWSRPMVIDEVVKEIVGER
ncbi:MAG: GGDEF domain-containing protein, partial [Pseudobutyrivibrio sp.]|nr:GGDEF domain-containing protein [Pseudobutyrivibrio sp.]